MSISSWYPTFPRVSASPSSRVDVTSKPLLMEMETVSKMSDTNYILAWLIAQYDITAYSQCESFKPYIIKDISHKTDKFIGEVSYICVTYICYCKQNNRYLCTL
jgi:hypothetical protein